MGDTTLVSIENSALLLFKQISFFKHSVGRLEQSQEGIFCAQLTDLGQSSALTKDSEHSGVFTKESSPVQLWPLLSVQVQPVQTPSISNSKEKNRRKLHRIRTGRTPATLHCLTSTAQKINEQLDGLLKKRNAPWRAPYRQAWPGDTAGWLLSHTARWGTASKEPGLQTPAGFHSKLLSTPLLSASAQEFESLQMTDIKQHSSFPALNAETLQELKHLPAHQHLLLLLHCLTSACLCTAHKHGTGLMLQDRASLNFLTWPRKAKELSSSGCQKETEAIPSCYQPHRNGTRSWFSFLHIYNTININIPTLLWTSLWLLIVVVLWGSQDVVRDEN